jgi:dihydrofolate reductase
MRVSLIVAVARNGVIGREGDLPWRLPGDMKWFKERTMGHHVLMGRRTWDSFPGPLPGRVNIVITRGEPELPEGVRRAGSLEAALKIARAAGDGEVFIAGGAQIYAAALPLADRIYLTRVEAEVEGDTKFPEVDLSAWRQVFREDHRPDDRHSAGYSFRIYERPPDPEPESED